MKAPGTKLATHYRTAGTAQTKTWYLPKGKYQVLVTGKCGILTTTTKSVTLKK